MLFEPWAHGWRIYRQTCRAEPPTNACLCQTLAFSNSAHERCPGPPGIGFLFVSSLVNRCHYRLSECVARVLFNEHNLKTGTQFLCSDRLQSEAPALSEDNK